MTILRDEDRERIRSDLARELTADVRITLVRPSALAALTRLERPTRLRVFFTPT